MPHHVKPKPEGYHTATPSIIVKDADKAIEFYKSALGAEELDRMTGPDGRTIMHAEIRVGDSRISLADESPMTGPKAPTTLGGSTGALYLYVPDTDAAFRQAVEAGAKPVNEPMDMFWGDRSATVVDPFGHHWWFATRMEDLSPEEIGKRAAAFYRVQAAHRPP